MHQGKQPFVRSPLTEAIAQGDRDTAHPTDVSRRFAGEREQHDRYNRQHHQRQGYVVRPVAQ